ncbi:Ppx/GppA family phosphatase [Brevibacillus humidisoli]|uniref:Ppx/GppA phosphatase family protein n=1 Tax=Brevibacillus humidisoli TaxID=2895522 RepID=UPI001E613148|nr:Ppx/GppA phosphatase family protein [Brevibacillus humidisoli]UFJ41380.1 Ppx/GppA family phosphatase [Brevibacillus humidisoli]
MESYIGMIDLGSNTARLVVYHQDNQGLLYEIDNMKRTLRLSNYLHDGYLAKEGIDQTLSVMRQFRSLLEARQVKHVVGVATAAVRQARNGLTLLKEIEHETGISIRLLSGEQEARYGFLAVASSMNLEEGITIDIGGGSTEITYFTDRRLQECISLPFGVVTLSKQFLQHDPPTSEELEQLRAYVAEQLAACPWIWSKRCPVVAIGGTARNLAKIHQRQIHYSMASLHHYTMSAAQVDEMLELTGSLPLEQRKQLPGLSKDRADVIIPGIIVFEQLLKSAAGTRLLISNKGLRDGLLHEKAGHNEHVPAARTVRQTSIEQFMTRYQMNRLHAFHVRHLASSLFDHLNQLNLIDLGSEEKDWLEAAALLHDIGRSINVYESSQHTFYLLSHVLLPGFSHRERLLIAMISSYKNSKQLQAQLSRHSDIVDKSDKKMIELLGYIILLARALDRSMTQQIQNVLLRMNGENLVLECVGTKKELIEYSLLQEVLVKMSKLLKRPVTYLAIQNPAKD